MIYTTAFCLGFLVCFEDFSFENSSSLIEWSPVWGGLGLSQGGPRWLWWAGLSPTLVAVAAQGKPVCERAETQHRGRKREQKEWETVAWGMPRPKALHHDKWCIPCSRRRARTGASRPFLKELLPLQSLYWVYWVGESRVRLSLGKGEEVVF